MITAWIQMENEEMSGMILSKSDFSTEFLDSEYSLADGG